MAHENAGSGVDTSYCAVDAETVTASLFRGSDAICVLRLGPRCTFIEDCAFENCRFLEQVEGGASVRVIGRRAFAGCESLESTGMLGAGVVELRDEAFDDCGNLVSIAFPCLRAIVGEPFRNCYSLDYLAIASDIVETVKETQPDAHRWTILSPRTHPPPPYAAPSTRISLKALGNAYSPLTPRAATAASLTCTTAEEVEERKYIDVVPALPPRGSTPPPAAAAPEDEEAEEHEASMEAGPTAKIPQRRAAAPDTTDDDGRAKKRAEQPKSKKKREPEMGLRLVPLQHKTTADITASAVSDSPTGSADPRLPLLIQQLSTGSAADKEDAARTLGQLVAGDDAEFGLAPPANQIGVRAYGGIEPLVGLAKDSAVGMERAREWALAALGLLAAANGPNVAAIAEAGGLIALVGTLRSRSSSARTPHQKERAAFALGVLADTSADMRERIAELGAIVQLVAMVKSGTAAQQYEAASALGSLSIDSTANQEAILKANGIKPLVHLARTNIAAELALELIAADNAAVADAIAKAEDEVWWDGVGGTASAKRHV